MIEGGIVSVIAIFILTFIFFRNKIIVLGPRFYYRFRSLKFDQMESEFLLMMLRSDISRVSNQTLLKIFDDNSLDLGTITRKKNQFTHDLNEKLKFLFRSQNDFLITEKSSSDRRNTYYFLDTSKFLIIKG